MQGAYKLGVPFFQCVESFYPGSTVGGTGVNPGPSAAHLEELCGTKRSTIWPRESWDSQDVSNKRYSNALKPNNLLASRNKRQTNI